MRSITNDKIKKEEQSRNHIKNKEERVVRATTHNSIPNMRDAYSKVKNNDYEPTDSEISYRQLSTSGYVKH